nr:radical SAM protein [uncultured Sellimonas sp.]
MTDEELFASIYTHDTIYLPPSEQHSAALETVLGCSHAKCRFCDFARDPFRIHPMEQIRRNMQILGRFRPDAHRLFLLGENAFVLDYHMLNEIFDMTDSFMPNIHEFAMYSRVDDIARKTDEELKSLHQMGLTTLHIGLESGSDSILLEQNKGVTSMDMLVQLRRLEAVGIEYYVTIILGLGGRRFSVHHALSTARLLNQLHPADIWCLKLKLWPDTPLYKDAKKGHFEMMNDAEMLWEERIMLENLTVKNCMFHDTTVLNAYTIQGRLPEEKDALLDAIDFLLASCGY